jgi:hypothetical protein
MRLVGFGSTVSVYIVARYDPNLARIDRNLD